MTVQLSPVDATSPEWVGAEAGRRVSRWRLYGAVGGAFLVLSLLLWWHVLPHPRSVTTCGCGDAALTLWVIRWPAYAISHGLNPFYSSKLFVPRGINMAPNSLGLGIATAPITWLFGPVASLNFINIVSPPLSAVAMFWLLRRWVSWTPAAFVGGLLFGFSPFVLVSLAFAHPNFGLLAPIPLIIGCLDDLFVRHRFRPIRVGAVLGVLVTIEFFISVEVLSLLCLFAAGAAVLAGIKGLLRDASYPRQVASSVVRPLGLAVGVSVVLLVYPVWFFFAGPAHLSGRAWPNSQAGTVENSLGQFVNGMVSAPLTGIMHNFGGYLGPTLPLLCTLGIGVVAIVLVGGAVLLRREPLVQLFGVLGFVAVFCSLGVGHWYWTPWRLFVHLPVLNNVVPVNISVVVDTCAAIIVAVVMDRVRCASPTWRWGARAGWAIAAIAVVPLMVLFWPNIPITVRPVVVPQWFSQSAPRLGSHLTVLPYPAALGGIAASMSWQAVEGDTFSMVGGGGPGIVASRAGTEEAGFNILEDASVPLSAQPIPTSSNLAAIRQALAGWGVKTIVVPDQPTLPSYERGRPVPYAVALFTAALGSAPTLQSKAWVWQNVDGAGASIPLTEAQLEGCLGSPASGQAGGARAVADCVLHQR